MEEQYLYGSKRLGVRRPQLEVARAAHNPNGYEEPVEPTPPAERFGNACLCTEPIPGDEEPYYPGVAFAARFYTHTLGMKEYEITNHLGNVLATVLDRKTGVKASPTATTYAYFKADVTTAQDYYPFGSLMPGRTYVAPANAAYRFGFNGLEVDDEKNGKSNSINFKFRVYDCRIGRFLSIDPLGKSFPWNSSYAFAENRVIEGIDYEGLEYLNANAKIQIINGAVTLNQKNLSNPFQHRISRNNANVVLREINFQIQSAASANNFYQRAPGLGDVVTNSLSGQPAKTRVVFPKDVKGPQTRNFNTASSSGRAKGSGAAALVEGGDMALNAIQTVMINLDISEADAQIPHAVNALRDVSEAINKGGYIDQKYMNELDLSNIANVVLTGKVSNSRYFELGEKGSAQYIDEITKIGMRIFNELSNQQTEKK